MPPFKRRCRRKRRIIFSLHKSTSVGGGGREGEEGGERERDCHSRGSRASVAEGGNFIKKE